MQAYAVLASGPSLNDEDVAYVREARNDGRISGVVAVSNVGLDKAPWADILVSYDSAWWRAHPEALEFSGAKYASKEMRGVKAHKVPFNGCNSGLMGMFLAQWYGAERLILLGFDMHGTHYFGPHTRKDGESPLKNSDEKIFNRHKAQFRAWNGVPVINCTQGSALTCFPIAKLRDTI